ncbi:VIT domain-containing protein [Nodularia spumigena]|uniref:VIT domain-containing protein n=1 Tax=Nodularia spumigena TaxID=70799 RepID=UPI002B1F3F40|nr:VIT domain-containing protein [Nodularia spumigena]MEA5557660.1 VIT domain-containing protein [Nodularia spumigena CH309]
MLLAAALMFGVLPTSFSYGQAADMQVASPQVSIVVPQSRVLVRPGTRPSVGIREVGAHITIREQVASTTLTILLSNATGTPQEAQIILPVPDGSTVRSFVMEGMPNEGQAQIYAREEARRIYESIVRSMRDPGLVEFAGLNLVKTSVFPVAAGGTQKVHLTYEQVLHADGSRVDYMLPRTESLERSDISWSIRVDLQSARPISTFYSPSHELVVERKEGGATIAVTNATDPGSFRLSYIQETRPDEGLGASLLAYPDAAVTPDGGYMLLIAGIPELPADRPTLKREVIVAIDTSGSMRGQKLEQARAAALQVIEALADGEAFNIITYADSVATFSTSPVIRNEESVARARAYLANVRAMGGTNIHDAIVEAMRQQPSGDATTTIPLVLFLTDGLATVGKRSEVAIREAAVSANVHKRRIFTFGVGFDVNAPLLSALAQSSRATSTFVLPNEDVEVKVGQVFKRLSGPVLAEPRLVVLGSDGADAPAGTLRELLPSELPDLFEGDQLVLLGQYTSSKPVRLAIEGNYLGTPRRFEYAFDFSSASTTNGFVPRLWASRKIAVLIDSIRQATADGGLSTSGTNVVANDPKLKELVDEIVRLSTEFGILTEYTAFLAIEEGAVAGLPIFRSMPAPGAAYSEAPEFDLSGVLEGQERARESISTRAASDRAGAGGVNQSVNLGKQVQQSRMNARNEYIDEAFNAVQSTSVKQVGDQTLYRRDGVWMDARVANVAQVKAARTIEFASDDYFTLIARLAKEGRQGMLAERADTILLIDTELILVKGPGT